LIPSSERTKKKEKEKKMVTSKPDFAVGETRLNEVSGLSKATQQ
jgi:hypothetical protein